MSTTTRTKYLSPPEVASILEVTHHKVIAWINSGELEAYDFSENRASRPRWRISQANIDAFLERRASSPTPPVTRRQRRKKADGVIQFYPEK